MPSSSLIKVTPEIIQDHATAINLAVASIESHQTEINKIVFNPALQMSGQDKTNSLMAVQKLNSDLAKLNLSHTNLASAVVQVSNAHVETDNNLARQV